MKKIAVIGVVLGSLVFLGGCAKSTSQPVSTPESTVSSALSVTPIVSASVIKYTDNGFDPKTITVKAGSPVTFVNESSKQMWVASNPHPVHTDLTGFDMKKGVAQGGTYTFTFTKAGNWGFHDHLNPSDTGVVVAE